MPIVRVRVDFTECNLKTQVLGGSDEHALGTVHYTLTSRGKTSAPLTAGIKLTSGARHGEGALEVMGGGWDGPFHQDAFRKCVDSYVRRVLFVEPGGDLQVELVRMKEMVLGSPWSCEFEADDSGGGW